MQFTSYYYWKRDNSKSAYEPRGHQAGGYPGFCSMKRLAVFLFSPGWDASPSQGYPQHKIRRYLFVHLGGESGTVRVKCLVQDQNTMSPARARARTARSRNERSSHEANGASTNSNGDEIPDRVDWSEMGTNWFTCKLCLSGLFVHRWREELVTGARKVQSDISKVTRRGWGKIRWNNVNLKKENNVNETVICNYLSVVIMSTK